MNNFDITAKRCLAWLCVKKSYYDVERMNTHCYVYPRYFFENSGFSKVDPALFPERGAVLVDIKGGKSSYEIEEQFGNIVVVKFNTDPEPHINPDSENKLYTRFNPSIPESDIKITSLPVSAGLRQIIEFNSTYEILEQYKQIESEQTIATPEVLIKIGDFLYGPFSIEPNHLTISAISQYHHYVGKYTIKDFEKNILTINNEHNVQVASLLDGFHRNDIFNFAIEKYDWIPDDIIIKEMVSVIKTKEKKMSREEKRRISSLFEEAIKTKKSGFWNSEYRINKALDIISEINKSEELREQIVYEVLNTEEYIESVVSFIEKHRFDMIKDKLENVSKAVKERDAILAEKNMIEQQLSDKKDELNEIERNIEQKKEEIVSEEVKRLESIKEEIVSLNKRKKDLIKYNNIAESVLELEKKCKDLKDEEEKAKKEHDKWVGYKKDILKELKDKISDLTSATAIEAIDRDFIQKIMQMLNQNSESQEKDIQRFNYDLLRSDYEAEDVIESLRTCIVEKAGRIFTRNDIVNILICLTQGFITTFAGEPGTGKTSLCNIIARALGLARDDNSRRFVEVSVERGWSSYKDFIGYYNPLTKSFEKSNSAVFNALKTLNSEGNNSRVPYLILLDEANLSPIEHYWANFIRICDLDSYAKREINMGGDVTWSIPETLRFVTTVNFDHTTEELSPRFLDRTWLIMLDQSNIVEDIQIEETIDNNDFIYDFETLLKLFAPTKSSEDEYNSLDDDIKTKWNNIQDIFISKKLPISPRSKKMVENFCLVATKYMEMDSAETRYAPLDYAVAQKILPTINGFGEKYKQLMEALLDECKNGMPLCRKHIERMKESEEENMGYYAFFTR